MGLISWSQILNSIIILCFRLLFLILLWILGIDLDFKIDFFIEPMIICFGIQVFIQFKYLFLIITVLDSTFRNPCHWIQFNKIFYILLVWFSILSNQFAFSFKSRFHDRSNLALCWIVLDLLFDIFGNYVVKNYL